MFTALNVGLFAAITSIGSGSFPTGIGFGLFGLLSLVRLRSAAFTLKDVAYTFVALVLALINGLPDRNLLLVLILDIVLLVAIWVVDESRSSQPSRVMRITLDQVFSDLESARAEVQRRLGVNPLSLAIDDVDLVRETTRVSVRHTMNDSWWQWADAQDEAQRMDQRKASARMSADSALASNPFDVTGLSPVSLATVVDNAAQLTRVDRKYLVRRNAVGPLLATVTDRMRVLTIEGRRWTTYRSTYFDTIELATCRAHVQGRRRRWKARSRLYVEDDLCRVEVKTRNGRGQTSKLVATSHPSRYGRLEADDADFVSTSLTDQGIDVDARSLRPSMEVSYHRVTLADLETSLRMTMDSGVTCLLDGNRVWVDSEYILIETKGGLRPSEADRALSRLGARPLSFSKYVSAAALLRDDISDNDVRRLHGHLLHSARLSTTKQEQT